MIMGYLNAIWVALEKVFQFSGDGGAEGRAGGARGGGARGGARGGDE
jgi:hypothetical protein